MLGITPNTAVAICTLINLSIAVLNFILTVHNIHYMNELNAMEDKNEEENENE